MTGEELAKLLGSWGQPAFRARQIREFLFRKGVAGYEQMTSLPKALRTRLAAEAPLYELEPVGAQTGDEAAKWLWKARDGELLESVQIRAPGRLTSCLSSQVGCPIGCVFCATGRSGFERNLQAHEMLEQFLRMWGGSGERSSHVVFMGMGEPLLNYEQVLAAVRALNAPLPEGCGIAARRITLSTVGIAPGIRRLAGEELQLELAVSLHAPDDQTRRKLIPAARRHSIAEVMSAAREFSRRTGRLVTYEYVLLANVNDSPAQARQLAALLRDHPCKVNLIPFNHVQDAAFERPGQEAQERFRKTLAQSGVAVTIRCSKGGRIAAACGQLRRRQQGQRPVGS
jgi:23S rRNA (adenine2503-C2)-methyltransferase